MIGRSLTTKKWSFNQKQLKGFSAEFYRPCQSVIWSLAFLFPSSACQSLNHNASTQHLGCGSRSTEVTCTVKWWRWHCFYLAQTKKYCSLQEPVKDLSSWFCEKDSESSIFTSKYSVYYPEQERSEKTGCKFISDQGHTVLSFLIIWLTTGKGLHCFSVT